ncbi:beta strand repeat-containing protein [Anaerobiospirillum succiniciproducens]|uniref:beta strand repeat-containing protein n=1 Tax=Anaerobiospirillum succiniciproducens TaxID=13335 RepID=UPI000429D450|nr:hypothetical protein [Anaerobiospirillum succiniciproducens]
MKQTNNAIKFLMAQYRAIFKNANIAMVAAMAAAALAAGSANAAAAEINAWNNDLTADPIVANGTDKLVNISGGTVENTTGFDLTITGGDGHVIKGESAQGQFTVANGDNNGGKITVNGADAVLTIGGANNSGASVTIKDFANNAGKVVVEGGNSHASALVATNITIGSAASGEASRAAAGEAPAASSAIIEIGASGSIGDASATESFNINNGGKLLFTKAATATDSKAASKNGITVDGGTIAVENSGNGLVDGNVKVKAGSIEIGGTDKNTSLKVSGAVTFEGGTLNIAKSGTLTLAKADSTPTLDLSKATVTNAGTIDLGAIKNETTAKLTMTTAQYDAVFAGKVTGSGDNANTHLEVNVDGTGELNLDTVVVKASGAIDANKLGLTGTNGGIIFNAKNADVKFTGAAIKAEKAVFTFGSLTAGGSGALEVSGSTVNINKGLTITGATASQKGSLKVLGGGTFGLLGAGTSTLNANVQVGQTATTPSSGTLSIAKGAWTVGSLDVQSGSVAVTENGSLAITGDLTTTASGTITATNGTVDASRVGNSKIAESGVKLQGGKLIIDKSDMFSALTSSNVTWANGDSTFKATSLSGDGASVLQIENIGEVNADSLAKLKQSLTNFKGLLQVGELSGIESETDVKKWSDTGVKDKAAINGLMTKATIEGDTIDATASVGNIKLSSADKLTVSAASGSLVLNKADANLTGDKAQFVFTSSGDLAGAAVNGDGAKLILASTGEIGSITTDADNHGSLEIGHLNGVGNVTVKGGVGETGSGKELKSVSVLAGSSIKVKSGDIFAKSIDGKANSVIKVDGKIATDVLEFNGKTLEANTLSLVSGTSSDAKNNLIAGGADVTLTELAVGEYSHLQIGTAGDGTQKDLGSSAQVYAGTYKMAANSSIFVDPNYGTGASLFSTDNITDSAGTAETVAGKVAVGRNSAFGVGFASQEEFEKVISPYLVNNGGFSGENGSVKNALVLNKAISITATTGGISVDESLTKDNYQNKVSGNSLHIGAGSALIITEEALKNGAAVKFNAAASVTASGTDENPSKIILDADITKNDTGKVIFGTTTGTVTVNPKLKGEAAGGLLNVEFTDGKLVLSQNDTRVNEMRKDVSAPVGQLIVDYVDGAFADANGLGAEFVGKMVRKKGYKALDAASHAATYAGAQQAAVVSVTTMADAMSGRVGSVGVEAASIAATGSQANGGVWLTPMYKSMDSDGFNAEGVSYGSDVDAAGVAFGADTVNGNMRFGAVFNIGSGDAEGKGQGNGLKDEFDYYGFGIYSAMGFGNLALVGDASMTVVSHEVQGLGLRGEADTTAVTMGLTGQYTVSTPMVDAMSVNINRDIKVLSAGQKTMNFET